jgi:hypothetical protein
MSSVSPKMSTATGKPTNPWYQRVLLDPRSMLLTYSVAGGYSSHGTYPAI